MIRVTDKQFWMHPYLKSNLDSMVYDTDKDFSFVVLVSGDGKVRVGKTVIAAQCAYYMAWRLKRSFTASQIMFSGRELVDTAVKSPPSVYIYDEAGESLDTKKVMTKVTRNIMDYFKECGTLNHIVFVVLPDFFELPRGIAISRSEALINVFLQKKKVKVDGEDILSRQRGKYFYFGEEKKKLLYLKGKKDNDNYSAVKADFWGDFHDYWPIDREAYEKRKREFISRNRFEQQGTVRETVQQKMVNVITNLRQHPKTNQLSMDDIGKILGVTRQSVYNYLRKAASLQKSYSDLDTIPSELM